MPAISRTCFRIVQRYRPASLCRHPGALLSVSAAHISIPPLNPTTTRPAGGVPVGAPAHDLLAPPPRPASDRAHVLLSTDRATAQIAGPRTCRTVPEPHKKP